MLPAPVALLLDFGGVLAEASSGTFVAAPPELVLRLYNLTDGAVTPGEISRSLTRAEEELRAWRDRDEPAELTHEEVWRRFVTPGWPPPAREVVRLHADRLTRDWAYHPDWELRPGIPEALGAARAAGLPLAVVSNTMSGAAHRDFLTRAGIGDFFAVQVYSDEAGVRKPNPEMIWHATRELGVPTGACWFVGDSYQRDVQCARRAGAGAAILFPSRRTDREKPQDWPAPDAIVTDGFALRDLLPR